MSYNWKKQASAAYGAALARLTLNAYMYVEELPQSGETLRVRRADLDERFSRLLEAFLKGKLTKEEALGFRTELGRRMELVLAYADCFRIYEYALNRVERRFLDDAKPTGYSDEDMVRALMAYLTSGGDSALVNQRVQQIIGQLPVRFTRQKYYSMVRDALSVYIGADQEGLKNVMYLLRTGSMSELSDEQLREDEELFGLLQGLKAISFQNLTTEEYRDAQAKITIASERLNTSSDLLQLLEEMVNDIYLLMLTEEAAVYDVSLKEHAYHIMNGLSELCAKGCCEIPQELEEELSYLEGVQEEYMDLQNCLDPVPAEAAGEDAERGRIVEKLISSSSFAELNDSGEAGQSVDRNDVDCACDAYILASEPVLRSSQKPVSRAIMATTLAVLPVCFNSLDEIRNYIEGSLASCVDPAEKETCKELLIKMMESERNAVL
jgi:hypothetical protein